MCLQIEEGSGGGGGDPYETPATPSIRPTDLHATKTPYVPSDRENFIVTDRISNSPPILQRKLKKIPVTAGKSIRYEYIVILKHWPMVYFSSSDTGAAKIPTISWL